MMSSPASTLTRPSTHTIAKTEVRINVYDLLPVGRLSSFLWTIGTSLLHTGVAIGDKEYAFGGHDRLGVTGVYWTKPKTEPPGGTWKCEIMHGFTYANAEEIEEIVREVSPPCQYLSSLSPLFFFPSLSLVSFVVSEIWKLMGWRRGEQRRVWCF